MELMVEKSITQTEYVKLDIIEAKANELLAKSLTDNILREMYIDKWNGVLPDVVAGDSSSMMIPVYGDK